MHHYEWHTLDWRGMLVEVRYCRSWSKLHSGQPDEFHMAHIEIETIEPARATLPITETGYRSHFVPEREVIAGGGALAYVEQALDEAASCRSWKTREQETRQYQLF
ncbi:hypothetical protein [Phaeobacter inhibens]|uniref:hypothetical protein n=1 Tax=Phaeobacter inhibens TaxID=221822 RepID=UPI00076BB7E1|nr:hypothetical protein [Phaeobacter inhibens]KXF91840.1 hypothetical protein AT574_05070 [Phaeobacter inhibens]WHP68790.1 hypothetical protein QMZ01_00965 [Phaeobacter inhibens]